MVTGSIDAGASTRPNVAGARAAADSGGCNLWAGQAHWLAQAKPAGALVRELAADARSALRAAQ